MAGCPVYRVKTIKQCQKEIKRIIYQLKRGTSIEEDFFYELQTAANEVCYNAVEHGNRFSPSKFVQVRYYQEREQIVLMIQDQGTGFNPDDLADPTLQDNILKPRGRGIFLARHMVDELIFCDEGRKVFLVKKIKKPN